jgi:hypothetical protein
MARHRVYYKGGRWWLPPSSGHGESCESVFARGSSVHQKWSTYALTNLLFGLCRFVWVTKLLINLLSPYPRALARPSTPEVLLMREHASIPSPFDVFIFGLAVSRSKSLGVCHKLWNSINFWSYVVFFSLEFGRGKRICLVLQNYASFFISEFIVSYRILGRYFHSSLHLVLFIFISFCIPQFNFVYIFWICKLLTHKEVWKWMSMNFNLCHQPPLHKYLLCSFFLK